MSACSQVLVNYEVNVQYAYVCTHVHTVKVDTHTTRTCVTVVLPNM